MIPDTPALHVGETVAEVTVLDGRAVVVALVLMAAAVVVIWAPARVRVAGLPRMLTIRSTGRAVVLALAFFAVLPSVVPYDHLMLDPGSPEAESHAEHCHGDSSDCAGSSVSAVTAQFLDSAFLFAAPALVSVLLLFVFAPMRGLTRAPDLRPPLAAAA